jgi:hypothetical protein
MKPERYYIIEEINGERYNVGMEYSEEKAKRVIEENIAFDAKRGRDTRNNYSYNTNRYTKIWHNS